jgi:hypothetical protein
MKKIKLVNVLCYSYKCDNILSEYFLFSFIHLCILYLHEFASSIGMRIVTVIVYWFVFQ